MFFLKIIFSAVFISFVSWLSGKRVGLAGFLTALPLTTLLALAFSHWEWQNPQQSTEYAKSIFLAIPISLLFFVPFFFVEKTHWGFWINYSLGVLLLVVGYFLHQSVTKNL